MIITRIEIDGFKSFVDFSLDLHPFTVLIGANASGKSNVLDAVRFLTTAVSADLPSAVSSVRGDGESLFHQYSDGTRAPEMRFALEFLTDFGEHVGNRWRYEATIGRGGAAADRRMRYLSEVIERRLGADHWFDFVGASGQFRQLHQRDQGMRPDQAVAKRGLRRSLLGMTPVMSDGKEVAWLTDLALGLEGVKVYQFEGSALRQLSSMADEGQMASDGAGLPGYLHRIRESTRSEDHPVGAMADVQLELRGLLSDVPRFDVVVDNVRRDIRVEFAARNQPPFPASEASDGTLSALATIAALNDSEQTAPLLFDEPEAFLHPQAFRRLLRLLREMTSDPGNDEADWPLRQVVIASHSAEILREVPPAQVVVTSLVSRVDQGKVSTVTAVRRAGPSEARDSSAERAPMSREAVESFRSAGRSAI
ncbi:SMC domain protein [Catenulispora acidiphila DSM 44928]|uniref:SMC domain protein n=1 Tax=Catenulispora acidiphila (strain DSM 44928 / JCM 14897 / NBRC 102108 / NRRL B-24433 / ID139908) TaxID=479433 RepID=C7Q7F6_CATAD|nr:AAA family ATPase [Catenulispora acidiphila]ACU70244.1 SMC domain protein [Catenulispora acidiphila DSM 44928]